MDKLKAALVRVARKHPELRQAMMDNLREADLDGNYMSRQGLSKMAEQAQELMGMITEDKVLEDWMEAKIVRAADMLSSVYDSMKHRG